MTSLDLVQLGAAIDAQLDLGQRAELALTGDDLGRFFAEAEWYLANQGLLPRLSDYDVILINSSAGKDSQIMLSFLVWLADRQGLPRERLLVVHCNLGRVEWPGTLQLARAQALAYGLRFVTVARTEDLLDQVVTRHERLRAKGDTTTPAWPSSSARYCTSDQKTSQVAKLMTHLAGEHDGPGRIRILNCLGIRAGESNARAKKVPFGSDPGGNGRRMVDRWLPIFHLTTGQVWQAILLSALPYHPAYDLPGIARLSCVFCVLAPREQLVAGARANPALAAEYLAVEQQVGHTFKNGLSMAQICAEAAAPAEIPGGNP